MIVEGSVKVLKAGKQCVRTYGPGEYFGERALLRDQPRAATVVADSDQVFAVSLDRSAFKRLMGPLESILARNEEEYKKFC